MPKIKMSKASPHVDMTPMVDLFSLLLTFFMLTTSFKPSEAKQIDTPSSVSEKTAPDKNIITLLISEDNKVFFNIDNGPDSTTKYRAEVLKEMATRYNIKLTPEEYKKFTLMNSFGMPMKDIKRWINAEDPKLKEALQVGMPTDSADNQLSLWVRYARLKNPQAEVAIKGDGNSDYKVVKEIMDMLQENKVNKFNLVTNLQKEEAKLDNK
jgi:biopolymer transport protein ExbD